MIWISRGRGGWAFYILLLFVLVPILAADQMHLLPEGKSSIAQWIGLSGLLTAGLLVAPLGFFWNRGPGAWRIDPASGLRYFDKSANHSLYFIPMQYWGLLYCTAAISLMALKIF